MVTEEKDSREWEDLYRGWNNSGKLPKFGGNITHLKGSINRVESKDTQTHSNTPPHTDTHRDTYTLVNVLNSQRKCLNEAK